MEPILYVWDQCLFPLFFFFSYREQLELLVTTLIDLDAMDGKSTVSLLAECSSSPDVNTRWAFGLPIEAKHILLFLFHSHLPCWYSFEQHVVWHYWYSSQIIWFGISIRYKFNVQINLGCASDWISNGTLVT